MRTELPKQFLVLHGKPLLLHSMHAFYRVYPDCRIILVLPEEHIETWKHCYAAAGLNIPHQITHGGPTRFQSVKNGLAMASEEEIIAIHDGARPLVSGSLIESTFIEATLSGSAIPVIEVNESLRQISGSGSFPVDRSHYRIVQTPQVFRGDLLFRAYQTGYQPDFTDDATVVEQTGTTISLVPGDPVNIKITRPADLLLAESILANATYTP
jgi:2-C-methyl-D-erythritol 4-phosphate cytidylyltransferase